MKSFQNIRWFYIAFGIAISMLVVFGLIHIDRSRNQVQYIDAVEHAYIVLLAINLCENALIFAESSQRGYLVTGENESKLTFENTLPLISSSLTKMGKILPESSGKRVYFNELKN